MTATYFKSLLVMIFMACILSVVKCEYCRCQGSYAGDKTGECCQQTMGAETFWFWQAMDQVCDVGDDGKGRYSHCCPYDTNCY
ncbi:uncharacterized protein BX664DRAFT_328477 [Halteromyces radiatus]|uniref:uncharacterized protein n=1 Tax=Halteromyces radiatus TaxID=101107 RepID=UPI00221EE8D8|nr:uncharacterized protein BX664DRAFT_328477 [Halteromyces radiatus]KAI8092909.1 hypothetical protein BX664DRAFT_328477 [Halteromyces radiatus]